MRRHPTRRGVTLLELLVTIVVISIMAGAVISAFPPDRRPSPSDPRVTIARARAQAVDQARAISISLTINGRPLDVLALPDGRVVADSTFKIDQLSGR